MHSALAAAFDHRKRPTNVVGTETNSELREDAQFFEGKPWEGITLEDWTKHPDAFYGLSAAGFLYFLPSILTQSQSRSDVADRLVSELDTSAEPGIWGDWFAERFCLLTKAELRARKLGERLSGSR